MHSLSYVARAYRKIWLDVVILFLNNVHHNAFGPVIELSSLSKIEAEKDLRVH